jgi:hypothetical protein
VSLCLFRAPLHYVNSKLQNYREKTQEIIGENIWESFPDNIGQPFQLNFEKTVNEKLSSQMEEYYRPLINGFTMLCTRLKWVAIFFADTTDRKKKWN